MPSGRTHDASAWRIGWQDPRPLACGRHVGPERQVGRVAPARAAVSMLPALLVAGLRRAQVRRDALRLAGHATGSAFTPIIAVAALAAAGRLAFAAVPNVAPTYVIVFLGGILFGPLVG